ncbi:restriction endonuclease subunit S [Vibrio aestuarianus]|uniref:Type I restriction-modification system, specificity subunit S n=1 Tax=Vibrio aestuarianus TaxID=28171 RepID=A0ABN8TKZ5_9VIBR|nr:restriction endonuclease subunit S [Vibrio aestuarianus]MDE1258889.1 restriction endonuclease subunit S [Vibrio aestuarianus]MDE1271245.1 restriction endonuclease subunit S [Vibrio aestuarianus]MDE1293062.1 restriction endonuclease subunit S [Vibrio aestuarianus]MDE1307132.1 restriction endonuclease subunit S [Vibrio aestuarianus]MDH5890903.1 restriction endonuclease subunit S [Vibrio aestuarianus]
MTVATKKLHELADVFSGYAFKSKDLGENGIPVVKIKNVNNKIVSKQCDQFLPDDLVTERLKKYLLKQSDILVAMTGQGSLGRIGKMTNQQGQYIVNQRVGIVRPKSEDDSIADYLFGVLALDEFEQRLYSLGAGAGQPNVSAIDIGNLDIPYPSKSSRDFIAKARANYDNLIENNNQRIAILDDMAQSLYREWFVKFRYLGYQDNLDADGNPKRVDSLLGQIPEGWQVKDFSASFDFWNGKKCVKSEVGMFDLYGANGIVGKAEDWKYENAVIIGRVGAYCGAVEYCFDKFWGSDNTIIAKCKSEENISYLFLLLEHFNLNKYAGGAAQPLLTQATLKQLKYIAPPEKLISEFEKIAHKFYEGVVNLKKSNSNLKKQRDMLLPKLISGDIEL